MRKLRLFETGEWLEFDSISISNDIDNWSQSFTIELPDKLTIDKLTPAANAEKAYVRFAVTIGYESWDFIAETPTSQDTQGRFSIAGRSITALLDDPHAAQITQTWINSTAQTIILEMCDLVGVSLSFEINDWSVVNYSAQKQTPLQIIQYFAEDAKAKINTTANGVLTVINPIPVNPVDFSTLTPDFYFSTAQNIFERGKTRINNNNHNYVLVTTDSNNNDITPTIEDVEDGTDRIIKVRCKPFVTYDIVNLKHKSSGLFDLIYEGEFTEQVIDDIIIKDGKGELSKQLDSLTSSTWQQDVSGVLVIGSDGKINCSSLEIGLVTVTYQTRYLQYRGVRTDLSMQKTLLYTADIPADVATAAGVSLEVKLKGSAGDKVADAIVVKTLSNSAALLQCGLNYLWQNGYDVDRYSLDVPYQGFSVVPSKICEVELIKDAEVFRGVVKSVSISYGRQLTQQIVIDRALL